MDSDVLTSLLKGEHFNMEDRVKRGLWPHRPIKYTEVLEHLTAIIQNQEWFPADISCPREGVIIQNIKGEFIGHCLAYGSGGGRQPTLDKHVKFENAREAANFYLKNDLRLPGDLDGWIVE